MRLSRRIRPALIPAGFQIAGFGAELGVDLMFGTMVAAGAAGGACMWQIGRKIKPVPLVDGTPFRTTSHDDGKDRIQTAYFDFDALPGTSGRIRNAWSFLTSNGGTPPTTFDDEVADTFHVIRTKGTDPSQWHLDLHGWTTEKFRTPTNRLGDIPSRIMQDQAAEAYLQAVVFGKPTMTVVDRVIRGEKLNYVRLLLPRFNSRGRVDRLYAAMVHRRPRAQHRPAAANGFWSHRLGERLAGHLQSLRPPVPALRLGIR